MTPTMMFYINQEQATLTKILASYPEHFEPHAQLLTTANHWLILATGSSYNAALSAKYYIEHIANITFDLNEPYHYANYDRIDTTIDALLGISQSGQSTATIDAMAKVDHEFPNLPSLAITSMPGKELSQQATETLDIQCGHEQVGYVTMGFSSTIFSLMLLGLRVARLKGVISNVQEVAELNHFSNIISDFNHVITASHNFFTANQEDLTTATAYSAIAYGPSIGTLAEMQTKFTEVIRLPSSGTELEAFMHGPYLAINQQSRLFFIATPANAAIQAKAQSLYSYEKRFTDHVFKINFTESASADQKTLNLPAVSDEFKIPLIGATVFQVLAWDITTARGVDLSHQIFTDFSEQVHNKTETQHYV